MANQDTNKILLLDELSFEYSFIDPEKGLIYGNKARDLSNKLGWKRGLALAYSDLGGNYNAKSNPVEALSNFRKALKINEELENRKGVAAVSTNLSYAFLAQSNYSEALKYAFAALKIREKLQQPHEVGFVFENIGSVYLEMRNFSKAMEYYKKALKIFDSVKTPIDIARCKGNIATVLFELGQNNKALEYHFSALKIKEVYNDNLGKINTYINIGNVYFSLKQYNDALKFYELSLASSKELGSRRDQASSIGNIGVVLYTIGRENLQSRISHKLVPPERISCLTLAIKYLSEAIEICKDVNHRSGIIEFTETLSKAYLLIGDNKKSLPILEQLLHLKDSILLEQNENQVATLEVEHALELKDNELVIAALTAKNETKKKILLSISVVGLLSIVVVIFLVLKQRTKRHKNVLSEISYVQSHHFRAPVVRIMGLVQLYNEYKLSDPINKEIMEYIKTSTLELDELTKSIVNKTEI